MEPLAINKMTYNNIKQLCYYYNSIYIHSLGSYFVSDGVGLDMYLSNEVYK